MHLTAAAVCCLVSLYFGTSLDKSKVFFSSWNSVLVVAVLGTQMNWCRLTVTSLLLFDYRPMSSCRGAPVFLWDTALLRWHYGNVKPEV